MKKYIAFTLPDVVLCCIMWYIACSHTSQEKEMTPKEKNDALEVLHRAMEVAAICGPIVIDESENQGNVAMGAAALMVVGFAKTMGLSMHDCVAMVIGLYKSTKDFEGSNETH
jgi:cyanate permease